MVDSPANGLPPRNRACHSFSLIEMLVALTIFAVILVIVAQVISQTERAWKFSSDKIQAFQGARIAFDTMYRTLGESTLNNYYDYYNASYVPFTTYAATNTATINTFVPAYYGRNSDLHFISGKALVTLPRTPVTQSVFFQTPISYTATSTSYGNMNSLLNAVGFYIDFNSDQTAWPSFFTSLSPQAAPRYRYRLMEFLQPTEQMTVYSSTSGNAWFTAPVQATSPSVYVLAENIIACVVCPHLPGEMIPGSSTTGTALIPQNNYEYDSRVASTPWTSGAQPVQMHQLPPLVRLVLIAVDETSMIQIMGTSTSQPNLGFSYSSVFQNPANLTTDIATVSAALTAKHLNSRVFQTDVPIRGANWSQ